jgi:hypothetical protein
LKTGGSRSKTRRGSVQRQSVHVVREHFEPVHNAVIGQEMIVWKPV